jgi:hypothetical protein
LFITAKLSRSSAPHAALQLHAVLNVRGDVDFFNRRRLLLHGRGKVLVKAGEHVQASEVELSADELKEPLLQQTQQ